MKMLCIVVYIVLGTSLAQSADLTASPGGLAKAACDVQEQRDHYPYSELRRLTVKASRGAKPLPVGEDIGNVEYELDNKTYDLEQFAKRYNVAAFIALHDGAIVSEHCYRGFGRDQLFNFQSVTKSVVSTLLGAALARNPQFDTRTSISTIVPELKGTAYDGIPLHRVLQMASGAPFKDDDGWFGGMNKLFPQLKKGKSLHQWIVGQKKPDKPAKPEWRYSGLDTAALAWAVEKLTRMKAADYLSRAIWQYIGAERDAEWAIDGTPDKAAIGFCCLYATARDMARFGHLMIVEGDATGKKILPEGWVKKATIPSDPYVQPGKVGSYKYGYQYQWWFRETDPDAFLGLGIYGQHLYVNPKRRVVVVVTSEWQSPNCTECDRHAHNLARAIARKF
jgi:CubicO group peptidase (beta-lactamase class C family)